MDARYRRFVAAIAVSTWIIACGQSDLPKRTDALANVFEDGRTLTTFDTKGARILACHLAKNAVALTTRINDSSTTILIFDSTGDALFEMSRADSRKPWRGLQRTRLVLSGISDDGQTFLFFHDMRVICTDREGNILSDMENDWWPELARSGEYWVATEPDDINGDREPMVFSRMGTALPTSDFGSTGVRYAKLVGDSVVLGLTLESAMLFTVPSGKLIAELGGGFGLNSFAYMRGASRSGDRIAISSSDHRLRILDRSGEVKCEFADSADFARTETVFDLSSTYLGILSYRMGENDFRPRVIFVDLRHPEHVVYTGRLSEAAGWYDQMEFATAADQSEKARIHLNSWRSGTTMLMQLDGRTGTVEDSVSVTEYYSPAGVLGVHHFIRLSGTYTDTTLDWTRVRVASYDRAELVTLDLPEGW